MDETEASLKHDLAYVASRTLVPTTALPPHVRSRIALGRRRRAAVRGGVTLMVAGVAAASVVGLPRLTSPEHDSKAVVASVLSGAALPPAGLAARRDAVGAWSDGRFVVWGGRAGDQESSRVFTDGAVFDPSSSSWTRLPSAPITGRYAATSVATPRGVFVWGGAAADGSFRADGALLDVASGRWTEVPASPQGGRSGARAVYLDGHVVLAGGRNGNLSSGAGLLLDYDLARKSWLTVPVDMAVADAVRTDDAVLLVGVSSQGDVALRRFDVATRELTELRGPAVDRAPQRLGLARSRAGVWVLSASVGGERASAWLTGDVTDAWTQVGTWTDSQIVPPVDLLTYQDSQLVTLVDGSLAMVSGGAVTVLTADGSLRVHPRKDPVSCVAGAASAVSDDGQLYLWGGQSCRPEGPRETDRAVRFSLNS